MRYAIVQGGVVVNIVMWSGDTNEWTPPPGTIAVQSDTACVGDSWDGSVFSTPAPVAVQRKKRAPDQLGALLDLLVTKGVITSEEKGGVSLDP